MILAPTWKSYFVSRKSNARGNKSPAAYLSAWSDDTSPEAMLHLLCNDPDIAILAGDSGQNVMILHNFKNLGGTILSPSDKPVYSAAPALHPLSLSMTSSSSKGPAS